MMTVFLLFAAVVAIAVPILFKLLTRPSAEVQPLGPNGVPLPITPASDDKYDTDVIIVGAGVAGASLGAALAQRGLRVKLLEKNDPTVEVHRIVGELLQPSGVKILQELGLGEVFNHPHFDAQTVYGYHIHPNPADVARAATQGAANSPFGKTLKLDYPTNPRTNNVYEGRSFHNGRFLLALRHQFKLAAGAGNPAIGAQHLIHGKVEELNEDANGRVIGVTYTTKDSERHELRAPLTVVCDGLISSFRKDFSSNVPQTRSKFLGLVLTDAVYPHTFPHPSNPEEQLRGGNVFLADPTPILLYPISATESRMLIDFPLDSKCPSDFEGRKDYLLNVTKHQLPPCLWPSFENAVSAPKERSTLQAMPNMQLCARPMRRPGTLTIGDLLNVRHPLTGGGMTVAFTDVQRIVHAFESLRVRNMNDTNALDALVKEHYATRGAPVSAINILADALYDVFGQKYETLREACYDYLSQEGEMLAGPVRLLSGISRSQMLLVTHFFSVALWGCYRCLWPCPTPSRVAKAYLMLRDACSIIFPLIAAEHPDMITRALLAIVRVIFWVPSHVPRIYEFPRKQ